MSVSTSRRLSDILCVVFGISILVMSAISYATTFRMGYQVNTGIFCGLVCFFPMLLSRFHVLDLHPAFVAVIELSILLHAYGVLLLSYDLITYYDTITHFLSSVTVAMCVFMTLMCYQAYSGGSVRFTGPKMALFIVLIMLGFSAYWEVFEYIVDILTGTTMQYSPFDTLRDMLCNTCGTLTVSITVGYYMRNRQPEDFVEKFNLHPKLRKFISDPFGEKDNQ